jgi:hypothetical protein
MSENPYEPPSKGGPRPPSERGPSRPIVSEGRIFVAWLVFFLMATIGGGLIGLVVGAMLGFVLASWGAPLETIRLAGGISGFVLGVPVSYACYRISLGLFILRRD